MRALSNASAAVRNSLLRPARYPLANFRTLFLLLLALKPLLIRIVTYPPISEIDHQWVLSIGEQQFDLPDISFFDDLTLPQGSFPFGRFFCQYMTGMWFWECEFSCARFFKSLGSCSICFYFWHVSPFLCFKSNSLLLGVTPICCQGWRGIN